MVAVGVACLQYAGQRLDRVWACCSRSPASLLVAPTLRRLLPAGTLRLRPRPADGHRHARRPRGVVLRGRDVHPADAGHRAWPDLDPGRPLAHRRRARLGRRVLVPGPPDHAACPRHLLVRAGCVLVAVASRSSRSAPGPWSRPWTAAVAWTVGGRRHGSGDGVGRGAHAAAVAAAGPGGELGGTAGQRLAVLGGDHRGGRRGLRAGPALATTAPGRCASSTPSWSASPSSASWWPVGSDRVGRRRPYRRLRTATGGAASARDRVGPIASRRGPRYYCR